MQNEKDLATKVISVVSNLALFFLLYGILAVLIIWLATVFQLNWNGFGYILISVLCGAPFAILMFVSLKFKKRSKWHIAFGLPLLILPLLISLFLVWLAFLESPTHIFKDFVADPIPAGVSNIQSHNATSGFDEIKIIVAFNATPEVIDKLIADNDLAQVGDSDTDMDSGFRDFSNINLNQSWTVYEKNYSKDEYGWEYVTIWVNPERNLVLFQYWIT